MESSRPAPECCTVKRQKRTPLAIRLTVGCELVLDWATDAAGTATRGKSVCGGKLPDGKLDGVGH